MPVPTYPLPHLFEAVDQLIERGAIVLARLAAVVALEIEIRWRARASEKEVPEEPFRAP